MPVNSRKELEVDGGSRVASRFGTDVYFTWIFNKYGGSYIFYIS